MQICIGGPEAGVGTPNEVVVPSVFVHPVAYIVNLIEVFTIIDVYFIRIYADNWALTGSAHSR